MKLNTFKSLLCCSVLSSLICLGVISNALAEVKLTPADDLATVIAQQKGNKVTLKLESGEEISGTVKDVTSNLVYIGELTGKEFFDGLVSLSKIEAVIVRAKDK